MLVSNDVGQMQNIRVKPFEIAAGCALMYYPEANALVPRRLDPRSKTPAFKSVRARIVRSDGTRGAVGVPSRSGAPGACSA